MNHHITLLGLLLLVQTSLSAITCTWEGNTNSDWHTASNWDTGQVPTSIDDVIIVDGGTNIASGNQSSIVSGKWTTILFFGLESFAFWMLFVAIDTSEWALRNA